MDRLEALYEEIQADNIIVANHNMECSQSRATTIKVASGYGVFIDNSRFASRTEEFCVAAHEYGHASTGTTHKVYSPYQLVSQHEYRAYKWAVQKVIPWRDFLSALNNEITATWNLAEHFGVTEDFMQKAIYVYQRMGLLPA